MYANYDVMLRIKWFCFVPKLAKIRTALISLNAWLRLIWPTMYGSSAGSELFITRLFALLISLYYVRAASTFLLDVTCARSQNRLGQHTQQRLDEQEEKASER